MIVLGIDIGTTSISFAVCDGRNSLESYTVLNSSGVYGKGNIRQDADRILSLVKEQLEVIFNDYPDIKRLGVTGQMHGIVYTDKNGAAISPLYSWQDKSGDLPYKGTTYCRYINDETGCTVYSGYGMTTYFYHQENGLIPEEALYFCTVSDYIAMKLAGLNCPRIHISNAASLGLYDLKNNSYNYDAMAELGINCEYLPRISDKGIILGEYKGREVCLSIGDNQASFIGAVQDMDREILLNIGTGSQISCASDQIYNKADIETRPLDAERYLLVASALCGGRAYAMLEKFFRETAGLAGVKPEALYNAMEKAACQSGYRGLTVDTCFCGKRGETDRLGSITGISEDNFTPGALADGFLRGIANELFKAYQIFRTMGEFNLLRVSGNAARKNRYFREVISEIYKLPLQLTSSEEEAALGAALFASAI